MSASREKQLRQEQANSGQIDPKAVREAEQRAKEKRNNTLYAVIAGVFVLAVAVTLIWRSNIIQKKAPAVTIDGETYTATEVNFYYQNAYINFMNTAYQYVSLLNLDTTVSLKEQTVNETAVMMTEMLGLPAPVAGQTWHEYILAQALEQMATTQNALKQAEAEGFVFPDSVQAQYDLNMESLKTSAIASGLSEDAFLSTNFCPNMTQAVYGEHLLRLMKFDAYASDFVANLKYTDEKFDSVYAENPKTYDRVSYEAISISGVASSTTDAEGNKVEPTEAESAAAKEAAKKTAEEILAAYKNGETLEALAEKYESASYSIDEAAIYFAGYNLDEWLFDDARKDGDVELLEDNSVFFVALFHDRYREDYNTVDVRHILISTETGTKTSSDEGYEEEQAKLKADAKAKAEELYAQWQAGEATEESFAAMAAEHSTDPGSNYIGGLYTQVYQGQMVEAFNDWCFDSARKTGDTDIVETPYGYHIMYYSADNLPYWQAEIAVTLMSEDYSAWLDGLYTPSTVAQNSLGMRFVG